ncbi:glucose-6-phosphate isomerase [Caminibacter mediatlanticus TB-2]|uniref:Glucose-6-phosphate isomerase n=1 Tax=Caminibacter mediatlanticus TB-2 TaxID=391592 RepID=A0ABX5V925_9BACT|nr:glucose-6-phosphate isomerase [Caminibacter mediatlanticus]QCT94748.1 glucose-6-phosphate isomerase [Caminibacter mediatlanticus TB-2]
MIKFLLENINIKDENLIEKAFKGVIKEKEEKIAGYYDLPFTSKELLRDINFDANEIVVIGIGGSSLGTKAIYSMFKDKFKIKKMHFLENPDPIVLSRKLQNIKRDSLFFLVSKSGKTIETISIFKKVVEYFGFDFKRDKNLIVITDKNSPLEKFAKYYDLKFFNVPSNVGGRFSVLSAVGIVPLSVAGVDVSEILSGAREMIDGFFARKEDHILKKAVFLYENREKYNVNVLFSYGDFFEDFNKWFVQLWGESLGKKRDEERVGLTPVSLIGSIDQHSFLQLIMEGKKDKTVTFLKVDNFGVNLKIPDILLPYLEDTDFVNGTYLAELINKECDATYEALKQQKVPVDMIEMKELTYENVGKLIIYFELLTSLVGVLLGINTYNQPGVEVGKKILRSKY